MWLLLKGRDNERHLAVRRNVAWINRDFFNMMQNLIARLLYTDKYKDSPLAVYLTTYSGQVTVVVCFDRHGQIAVVVTGQSRQTQTSITPRFPTTHINIKHNMAGILD